MNWEYIVQCLNLTLGILLIIRLFSIKLHKIYRLLCIFLAADLLGTAFWVLSQTLGLFSESSYLLSWLMIRPVVWLFTLLMVYALLEKILYQLPGLLRLSKRVLHGVSILALLVGLASARYEYSAPGFIPFKERQFLIRCWITEMVLDRVIASIALLSLVTILAFLLWFPVTIPRNIAVFSVGFTIYFAAMTVLMLVRSLWPNEATQIIDQMLQTVNVLLGGVSSICFVFWILFLSPAGEVAPATITIQRQPQEQERLIAQLELINDALLKAARR
jgi:hypothetical protein